MVAQKPHFEYEEPLTTLISGDIALTATEAQDEAGARAQVVRRQTDGTLAARARSPGLHASNRSDASQETHSFAADTAVDE